MRRQARRAVRLVSDSADLHRTPATAALLRILLSSQNSHGIRNVLLRRSATSARGEPVRCSLSAPIPTHSSRFRKSLSHTGAAGSIDETFAHKPSVVTHEGVLYHFYCAVSGQYPKRSAWHRRGPFQALVVLCRGRYSERRATAGSTFMAARPGSNEATRATNASSIATARKLNGSCGPTLNSKLLRSCDIPRAAQAPMNPPTSVRRAPSHVMSHSMSSRLAPRAMRRPISCVRWAAANEMMP